MALAHSEAANPHWVPRTKIGDLSHIPGENGPPIIGTTFRVLRDPPAYSAHMVKTEEHSLTGVQTVLFRSRLTVGHGRYGLPHACVARIA